MGLRQQLLVAGLTSEKEWTELVGLPSWGPPEWKVSEAASAWLELLVWKALEAIWLEPLEWSAEQVQPLAQLKDGNGDPRPDTRRVFTLLGSKYGLNTLPTST
jgi:hypothetical protein